MAGRFSLGKQPQLGYALPRPWLCDCQKMQRLHDARWRPSASALQVEYDERISDA